MKHDELAAVNIVKKPFRNAFLSQFALKKLFFDMHTRNKQLMSISQNVGRFALEVVRSTRQL